MNPERLSRFMAYVLRHATREYGLEPDAEGFVSVDALLEASRRSRRLGDVRLEDLVQVATHGSPLRFEVRDDRIRAVYGHSTSGGPEVSYPQAVPPDILYHGTHPGALARIRVDGLRPMSRQYVHLSTNVERALQVGTRRSAHPIILQVRARQAHDRGAVFHQAEAQHWLVVGLAAEFIDFPE